MSTGSFVGGLMSEIKSHPWTTITAAIAFFGLTSLAGWSIPRITEAGSLTSEVAQIKRDLNRMEVRQQRRSLEDRLRQIESEIFSIKNKVDEIERGGRQADRIYYERLNALEADRRNTERNLQTLMQANPWLANDS